MSGQFFRLWLVAVLTSLIPGGITEVMAVDITGVKVDWEALNPEIKGATYVGSSEKCVECHKEYMQSFAINKHGINLMQDCESCHGPLSKHLEAPRRKPALLVALSDKSSKLSPEQKSSVCLQCHQGGKRMNWQVSVHASVDNACTTCHDIEAPTDPVLVKTSQTDVCFKCHQDKRSASLRRSGHPIREGKVVCSNCHNPHGSPVPTNLVKNTVPEVCYQCHQDKRGPFLWEHQPVREDCTICHDPHGSTHYRMLKVTPPYLCEECHQIPVGHPDRLREGGDIIIPGSRYRPLTGAAGTGGGPPGGSAESAYLLRKGCVNCHSNIHGSNHPSGQRFTR